jgi:hypothetical protein
MYFLPAGHPWFTVAPSCLPSPPAYWRPLPPSICWSPPPPRCLNALVVRRSFPAYLPPPPRLQAWQQQRRELLQQVQEARDRAVAQGSQHKDALAAARAQAAEAAAKLARGLQREGCVAAGAWCVCVGGGGCGSHVGAPCAPVQCVGCR